MRRLTFFAVTLLSSFCIVFAQSDFQQELSEETLIGKWEMPTPSKVDLTALGLKNPKEILEYNNYKSVSYSDWDEDEDEWERRKYKSGFFKGAAGGFDAYMLPLDIDEINTELKNIGLDSFDENIFMTGGGGWVFLGKDIRVGGLGAGGYILSSGKPEIDGATAKEVSLSLGYGGFTIEKAFHPFSKSELYFGAMIGGGDATLKLTKWSEFLTWPEIWNKGYSVESDTSFSNFSTYQTKIDNDFFVLLPTIGFRYNIFRWCAIGANVGYLYTRVDDDQWKIEGRRISNVPDIDFSNMIYRINVYFGG